MANHERVPSVISYSPPSHAQEQQWGADLSPNAVAMVHTKLALDIGDTSEELDLILDALDGMKNLQFQNVYNCRVFITIYMEKPRRNCEGLSYSTTNF